MTIEKSYIPLFLILLLIPMSPYSAMAADVTVKETKRLAATAAKGDVGSQLKLGTMYTYGIDVKADLNKGRSWLTKAAESGNSAAQMHLGLVFLRGRGVEKNRQEAMVWLKKAADQGEEYAQRHFSVLKQAEDWAARGNKGVFISGNTLIDDECSKRQHWATRIAVERSENVYADCVDMKAARRSLGMK